MKICPYFLLIAALLFSVSEVDAQRRGKRTTEVKIPLEGTVFNIRNVKAGRFIDVSGTANSDKARKNGVNVQLWHLDGGADQKFKFIPAGGGYYYIQSQHKKMNLDVHGCYANKMFCGTYKKDKGANIQMWSAGTSKPQQWRLVKAGKGKFKLKNRYSNQYLNADNSQITKLGCNIEQWTDNGGDRQVWELVDVKTGQKYIKPEFTNEQKKEALKRFLGR